MLQFSIVSFIFKGHLGHLLVISWHILEFCEFGHVVICLFHVCFLGHCLCCCYFVMCIVYAVLSMQGCIIRYCFVVVFGGFLSCSLYCSCPCGRLFWVFESC